MFPGQRSPLFLKDMMCTKNMCCLNNSTYLLGSSGSLCSGPDIVLQRKTLQIFNSFMIKIPIGENGKILAFKTSDPVTVICLTLFPIKYFNTTIRLQYCHYTATIRLLYGHCTATIQPWYGHFTATIRPRYSHDTATIRWLYGDYTDAIRLPYGYYTATVRPR